MHADVFGDLSQDHGFQMLKAEIEERTLKAHNALRDFVDRALALIDALHQPHRVPHLLPQIRVDLWV